MPRSRQPFHPKAKLRAARPTKRSGQSAPQSHPSTFLSPQQTPAAALPPQLSPRQSTVTGACAAPWPSGPYMSPVLPLRAAAKPIISSPALPAPAYSPLVPQPQLPPSCTLSRSPGVMLLPFSVPLGEQLSPPETLSSVSPPELPPSLLLLPGLPPTSPDVEYSHPLILPSEPPTFGACHLPRQTCSRRLCLQ